MKALVALLLFALAVGVTLMVVAVTEADVTPSTTTTTIDHEYARCMAIETHRSVLDWRDLETARYLADVACNDGKVRIP